MYLMHVGQASFMLMLAQGSLEVSVRLMSPTVLAPHVSPKVLAPHVRQLTVRASGTLVLWHVPQLTSPQMCRCVSRQMTTVVGAGASSGAEAE